MKSTVVLKRDWKHYKDDSTVITSYDEDNVQVELQDILRTTVDFI